MCERLKNEKRKMEDYANLYSVALEMELGSPRLGLIYSVVYVGICIY